MNAKVAYGMKVWSEDLRDRWNRSTETQKNWVRLMAAIFGVSVLVVLACSCTNALIVVAKVVGSVLTSYWTFRAAQANQSQTAWAFGASS